MSYVDNKKTFEKGEILTAQDLNNMGEGIVEAIELAQEGAAGAANMEKGISALSTQQIPRTGEEYGNKVSQKTGEDCPHFDFTGYERAKEITGKADDEKTRIPFGAKGKYSASMNGRSSAQSNHAFAANNSTIAKGEESFAAGYETIAEGNGSAAFGSRTWAKGTESHTEGILTLTEGQAAHAEGSLTKAKGDYSHAEGYMTEAEGLYSHTEGSATKTCGFSAHAEGNEAIADTNASHVEGSGTKVVSYQIVTQSGDGGSSGGSNPGDVPNYDDYESAEDFRVRYAACAHAEGNNTVAMGYSSHAEGVGTSAYGKISHAEGFATQTGELIELEDGGQTYNISNPEKGVAAHADGYKTKAIANYSHASGFETIADRDAQTVVGRFNDSSHEGSLFVVGAGNNTQEKINGLEVIQGGEIVVRWEGNYYSLNLMLNLIANKFGGVSFFDEAKKQ